jgi:hypothetical protein
LFLFCQCQELRGKVANRVTFECHKLRNKEAKQDGEQM